MGILSRVFGVIGPNVTENSGNPTSPLKVVKKEHVEKQSINTIPGTCTCILNNSDRKK
jgi:hypothetical protein